MSARDRPDYRHGNVEAAAVEAASSVLAAGGALTLRKVAARVGVSHGALYRHFADRDALLDAVAARGFGELAAAAEGAADAASFVDAYVGFAEDAPALYALMMSRPHGRFEGALGGAARGLIGAVRTALGTASDDDLFRTWMILHGGLTLHGAGVTMPRDGADLRAFLTRLIER